MTNQPVSRKKRKRLSLLAALTGATLFGALMYGWWMEPAQLVERDTTLALHRWPQACDGVRIDHLTDLHTGSWKNGVDNLDRIVERMVASDSDIVVLTGDYVILSVAMGQYVDATTIAEHLKPLPAVKPVYGVLGNHDWWKGGRQVSRAFAQAGVTMLDNRSTVVNIRGCKFNLVGVDDAAAGHPDLQAAYAQVDEALPTIALQHEPVMFPQFPDTTALVLGGHTHGGQVNPFGLRTPATFQAHSNALSGVFKVGQRTYFVSPGIGTSILPLRLGQPPEISRLTLRALQ